MTLAHLQDWMQARILDGAPVEARAHVRGDNRLTAEDRVAIYAEGYRARLLESLRGEYPVLAKLAGPTAFDLFALGYIAAHPSRSYTLYDFGAGFADYLAAARPAGAADAPEAIPTALARIERARSEVFRARGIEGDAPRAEEIGLDPFLAAILGLDSRAWRRPDSLRLLALPFDFTGTLAAALDERPPMPVARPGFVAVARAHYRVEAHPIEAWQYDWLAGLAEAGSPAQQGDTRLATWLPFAISKGLVTAA